MRIAAIIIGIDGWREYTLPLIQSLIEYRGEQLPEVAVIDNASKIPYRHEDIKYPQIKDCFVNIRRSETRLCYSAAINLGYEVAHEWNRTYPPFDWIVVLSNDVLCTGSFHHILAGYSNALVGPLLREINIERVGQVPYIEGWAICVPRNVWDALQGFDEGMQISSYEDVDYSHRARKAGFELVEDTDLPFKHLDQRQRFYLVPNYWDSEHHNRARFIEKHAVVND